MSQQIRPCKPEPVTRRVECGLPRRVAAWLSAPVSGNHAASTDAAHAERFDRIVKAHTE